MALLNIVAHGNPVMAAAGNRNPAQILLSVTDSTGAPVTGLGTSHITVDTLLVGAGGSNLVVTTIGLATFGGYYRINVVPTGTLNWASGEFDASVIVKSSIGDKAQTIAHFRVP